VAPFAWPDPGGPTIPNHPRHLAIPTPDLDPDIAMWPSVIVSIWPFTGTPPVGIWPTGWFGIDNRGVPYVCIAGGQPGTWQALTPGGGTNANALQGTPINAIGPTAGQSLVFDGTQWTPQSVSTPVGAIVMWGTAAIPASWLALNGQTVTGGASNFPALAALYPAWVSGSNLILPDYRNRFPVGGGNQYAVGSTGGAANTTLTTTQIPQFSVGVSFGGSTSSESAQHNHAFPNTNIVTEAASTVGIVASPTIQTLGIQGLISSSENVSHTHSMAGVSGSVTFGNASPAAVPTLPPYFGVNFIVKAA
jgi:microcystin-dependent protein